MVNYRGGITTIECNMYVSDYAFIYFLTCLSFIGGARADGQFLFFNKLPVWLFVFLLCVYLLLGFLCAVSCYFDTKNRRTFTKKLNVRFAPDHKLSDKSSDTMSVKAKKSDKEKDSDKLLETFEEAQTQHSVKRLDKHLKHTQLIEAIYIASGRQVPNRYRTPPSQNPENFDHHRSVRELSPELRSEVHGWDTSGMLHGNTIAPIDLFSVASTQRSSRLEKSARTSSSQTSHTTIPRSPNGPKPL